MNLFNSLLNDQLKNTFNMAIDAILSQKGLTVPCKLIYSGQTTPNYCNNCVFDPITKLSSAIYNGTGPSPFPEYSVCPTCLGHGLLFVDSSETIYIATIFDSKYFIGISQDTAKIADSLAQTLCSIEYLTKLRNATEILFDISIEKYGPYRYERYSDPMPLGFGSSRYISTTWKRK